MSGSGGFRGYIWAVILLVILLQMWAFPACAREVLQDPARLKQPELKKEKPKELKKEPVSKKSPVVETPEKPHPSPSAEPDRRPDPAESFLGPVDNSSPALPGAEEKMPEPQWQMDPNRGQPKVNIPLTIFSLLVVCIIIVAGLKLYSAYIGTEGGVLGGAARKMMVIREKQALSPNKQILLVDIPGKTVLLGVTDTEIKVLTEVEKEKMDQFIQDMGSQEQAPQTPASYLMDVLFRRDSNGGK